MIPSDPGRRTFLGTGIKGGHHDQLLHDFCDRHPQIVIVKESEKIVGAVYRKYSQHWWKGSGSKPALSDSRFPKGGDADAGSYHSDWALAKKGGYPLPKTTFENLLSFLLAVDEAWHEWYNANALLAHSGLDDQFTHFSKMVGVQITAFFDYYPPDKFRLRTVFVEASWF
jgi:hypothetical protein